MKTFNLFLETDDAEYGDFYAFAESIIGTERMNRIFKNAPEVQMINSQIWKEVIATKGPRAKWRPITRFNGNTSVGGFPADIIIGYLEENDSKEECLKKLESISFMNIFLLNDMETKARKVILSDHSAAEISRRTRVPESTIKSLRKKAEDGWLDTSGVSIKTLKGLNTFNED